MVVCGYSYDTTNLRFCYILRDPNSTSYQYLYTNVSDTVISYYIGGKCYDWDGSIYDFE